MRILAAVPPLRHQSFSQKEEGTLRQTISLFIIIKKAAVGNKEAEKKVPAPPGLPGPGEKLPGRTFFFPFLGAVFGQN